ncbi:hypothetical protein SAMN05660976_03187 [Nonomuraea pusilla]|uniref:Uncharacterized protein n=1 Tax=Nonomuraea pusilla TaxID=46177 RepID=A0A1H7SFJ7_9ACTN|nr:hypothetical protein SAMN05660976_03187 [Nonomuraea pusilla]
MVYTNWCKPILEKDSGSSGITGAMPENRLPGSRSTPTAARGAAFRSRTRTTTSPRPTRIPAPPEPKKPSSGHHPNRGTEPPRKAHRRTARAEGGGPSRRPRRKEPSHRAAPGEGTGLSAYTGECTTRYTRMRCGTPQRRSHLTAGRLVPRPPRPGVAPAPSASEARSSLGSGALTAHRGATARRDEGAGSRASRAGVADGRGGAAGRYARRPAQRRLAPRRLAPSAVRRSSGGRQAAGASSAAWSAAHCVSVRPFLPVTCSNVGETDGGSSAYSAW